MNRTSDVLDVSRPPESKRPLVRMLTTLLGGAGLALLFPLAILAFGFPVVLAVRALANAISSLLSFMR